MTNRQKKAPTLREIVDYVSEKLEQSVSVSCIQKDLYAMRYDESLGYRAPIEWDAMKRGYVYTEENFSIQNIPVSEEDLQGLEMAVGLLEQFKNIPAIHIFEDAITRIGLAVKQNRSKSQTDSILILDRPKRYMGIEYMADIVEAIRNKRVLRIMYKPFGKEEGKKHTVHPYFVKEYNGRMYLIGKDIHPTKESKFLTFAFDRILDVVTMQHVFQEEEVDKENYFRSAIGISLPNDTPEYIELEYDKLQANYIKSQALHHSQQVVYEDESVMRASYRLVVNYELISTLLSMGDKVRVIKPLHLRHTLRDKALAMAKRNE